MSDLIPPTKETVDRISKLFERVEPPGVVGVNFNTQVGYDAHATAVANIQHLESEPTKAIADFGVFGIIVLMNAKFRELERLMSKRRRKAQDEQIRKALRDISNYALVAQLVEGGKWPKG